MGQEINDILMCRICLSADVRLCPIAKNLQDMYEKLTALTFKREDGRPLVICYICHARLRNCYELRTSCLRGDELLTQMLSSSVLIQITSTNSLRAVSVLQFSLGHVRQKSTLSHVKELAMQTIDDIKLQQQCTEDIEKENQEHGAQIDNNIQISQTLSEDTETSNDIIKCESNDVETDIEKENQEHGAQIDNNIQISQTLSEDTETSNDIIKCESNDVETDADDISIDENGWEPYNTSPCSQPVGKIICPKIVKIILERIVVNDAKIGTPCLNNSRRATQISLETTRCKLNRIEKAEVKIVEPESENRTLVTDKPIVLSIKYKTDKVNATSKKLKDNKVTKCRDKVRKQTCNSDALNKKGLRSKANIKCGEHTRRGEKRFQCNVCNKYFTFKYQLIIHTRSHTGEKPFLCDTCKKGFTTKTELIEHIRTHTGEKSYMCDVCYKYFRNHRILNSHKRVHTGEKPYMCYMCKKCFSQPSSLTVHIRTHTDEKPYSCDVCKKCFKYRPPLKTHMRTHTCAKVNV